MVFTHDTEVSLQSAAILANSALEPDTLTTIAQLDEFYDAFEFTGRRDRDLAELEQVRAMRSRIREVLTADQDAAVGLVNEMLRECRAVPRLVKHDKFDWHLHAVDEQAPLATRILVETAMAMVDVIRSGELSRLGVCADEGCDGVVVDLSRNRSKRFCSTTCGNRNAVAAYRARQSDDAT